MNQKYFGDSEGAEKCMCCLQEETEYVCLNLMLADQNVGKCDGLVFLFFVLFKLKINTGAVNFGSPHCHTNSLFKFLRISIW